MTDQTQRLEIATVKAEIGSDILSRFSNDAVGADPIPTDSGDIQNLKQVIVEIQQDGADKISFATKIYATTAAGIAGTVNGEIFLVASAEADEIYAVWQNVSGVAIDTGKRAMAAQAIQDAMQSATEAAQAAEDSADLATARTARFLASVFTPPVIRDDGTPLQLGDRYVNTENQAEYIYKSGGWVANDSLEAIAAIKDDTDQAKGASQVGWDGSTVGAQLDLSKKLASYAALRNYSGRAAIVQVTNSRTAGTFYRDPADTTTADNGGTTIIDALGRRWKREDCDEVLARWFGENAAAWNAAITYASTNSLPCIFTQGTYLVGDSESLQVNVLGAQLEARGRVAIVNQVTASALGTPLISVDADLVSIKGIRFNGGRAQAFDNKSSANEGRFSLIGYGNTTRRGLTIDDCIFEDCRGKGVHFNASDVLVTDSKFRRIGRYVGDVTPIDAGITNWALTGTPDNVVLERNTFEYVGMFGSVLKDVTNATIHNNTYRYMSAIGAGFQGCTAPDVQNNKVSYTFNSGIDLQQCRDPVCKFNKLTNAGFGKIDPVTLAPRMYQAIYIGDDSTTNGPGNSLAIGGTVTENSINGSYVKGAALTDTEAQVGCGIAIVSTIGLTVTKNKIRGIGDRSIVGMVVDNKDGVGIKVGNHNIELSVNENDIADTKNDSIMFGIGDFTGLTATLNKIRRHGRHGISFFATTRIKLTDVTENTIIDGTNTQALAVASDIYISITAGWLADMTVSRNKCNNTARDSAGTAGATVYTTHGIYFNKGGSFAGLGTVQVADNMLSGHLTKEIAFSDVFTIGSKARYHNVFARNVDGVTDNGTGIIYDIPNLPDIAIEFVGTAIPAGIQFAVGSVMRYPFPTYDGYIGTVCVASGNPAVWRKFGLISAIAG